MAHSLVLGVFAARSENEPQAPVQAHEVQPREAEISHRDQFKKDWYWGNETHHSEPEWAWFQCFGSGTQTSSGRDGVLRARAVRRIPV